MPGCLGHVLPSPEIGDIFQRPGHPSTGQPRVVHRLLLHGHGTGALDDHGRALCGRNQGCRQWSGRHDELDADVRRHVQLPIDEYGARWTCYVLHIRCDYGAGYHLHPPCGARNQGKISARNPTYFKQITCKLTVFIYLDFKYLLCK